MEAIFADLLKRLEMLHAEYFQHLEGLSVEELDWSPGAEMNSLCVLAVHVTAAERFWIGIGIDDVPERDRPGGVPRGWLSTGRIASPLRRQYRFLQDRIQRTVDRAAGRGSLSHVSRSADQLQPWLRVIARFGSYRRASGPRRHDPAIAGTALNQALSAKFLKDSMLLRVWLRNILLGMKMDIMRM